MAERSTTGIKLDHQTKERLKALGEIRDRSPHYLMREAIAQYLDREEAIENERRVTLDRWSRYEVTGEAVAHDDVAEWIERRQRGDLRSWQKSDG